jgi:transcriptional regulator with GAF, ATPase, and Fis domain
VSRGQIEAALRQTDGNMSAAAQLLLISRAQIYVLSRKFGIAAALFRTETSASVQTEAGDTDRH